MLLRSVSVGVRTAAIGLVALAGFGAVGAVSLWADAERRDQAAATAALRERNQLIDATAEGFLQARRREKDFLIRLDAGYAAKHAEVSAAVLAGLDALAGRLDPDEAPPARALRETFAAYRLQFARIAELWTTLGLDENSGLQGRLRAAVHAAEAAVGEHAQDDLMVKLLLMRRHEKDFLLRLEPAYAGRLDQRVAEFDTLLAGKAGIPPAARQSITTSLAAYRTAFHAYVGGRLQLEKETAVLSDLYAAGEPKLVALRAAIRERLAASEAAAAAVDRQARLLTFALIGVIGALVVTAALVIGRSIARPVDGLAQRMARLAEGDTGIEVDTAGSDEVARMAETVLVFRDSMIRNRELQAEEAARQEKELARARRMNELTARFESEVRALLDALLDAAGRMTDTARTMSRTADGARSGVSEAASASERGSASVQTVATATAELSASISEIAAQIGRASQVVDDTVREAEATAGVVRELDDTAQRIGEIVGMIQAISEQTNLLALNATIEAARAGEAGRGFAVVASEVKSLAGQTSGATERIAEQIAGVQGLTQRAVGTIGGIARRVADIEQITSVVAAAVEEQSSATHEISVNLENVARAAEDLQSYLAEVRGLAQENGELAGSVLDVSSNVSRHSGTLGLRVNDFLEGVRAA